ISNHLQIHWIGSFDLLNYLDFFCEDSPYDKSLFKNKFLLKSTWFPDDEQLSDTATELIDKLILTTDRVLKNYPHNGGHFQIKKYQDKNTHYYYHALDPHPLVSPTSNTIPTNPNTNPIPNPTSNSNTISNITPNIYPLPNPLFSPNTHLNPTLISKPYPHPISLRKGYVRFAQ